MNKNVLKLASTLLIGSLVLSACGSKSGSDDVSASADGKPQQKTVTIFQFKTEIVESLNELAKDFEAEHPDIKLDIQTVGGNGDYEAALKTKFASGEGPDIFSNNGYSKLNLWKDRVEDLSDQPWVKDIVPMAKAPMTIDGKIYGLPMNLEGFGYVYNKDIFNKLGITTLPKTYSELEAVAKKISDAGITPFANAYQEWWLVGSQGISVAFNNENNVDEFIQGLKDGSASMVGNKNFENWAKLMQLTLKYGNKNPLTTDYNTQVSIFANGQAAMMQEGNWAQTVIDGITPNMNIGILPMPISDDASVTGKVTIGVPMNLVVNKDSKVKEEAKVFLNWLVTSDAGKEYIVKKFKFIPAMTTIEAKPEDMGAIATDLVNYVERGEIYSNISGKFPDGVPQEFGSAIQEFLAGKIDVTKWTENMQAAWDKLK